MKIITEAQAEALFEGTLPLDFHTYYVHQLPDGQMLVRRVRGLYIAENNAEAVFIANCTDHELEQACNNYYTYPKD